MHLSCARSVAAGLPGALVAVEALGQIGPLSACGSGLGVHSTNRYAQVDPEIALNANYVMLISNNLDINPALDPYTGVRFLDKCALPVGGCQPACRLESFFPGTVPSGWARVMFDPEIHWDNGSSRFFATVIERVFDTVPGGPEESYLHLAVSHSSNPSNPALWYKHRILSNVYPDRTDQPTLAVDGSAVYVGLVWLSPLGNEHRIYIYNKSSLVSGSLPSPTVRSLAPAGFRVYEATRYVNDGSAQYLIGMTEAEYPEMSNALRVYAVTDPLGSATVWNTTLTLPWHYTAVPGSVTVPQPGGSFVAGGNPIIPIAVYQNGSIWIVNQTHTTDPSDQRVIGRWFEIKLNGWPTSGTPQVFQSGVIDPGAGIHIVNPSIAVAPDSAVGITYSRSSASQYASMYSQTRCPSDTLGTLRPPVLLKAGVMNPGPMTLLGDYSGTDPDGPSTFYGHCLIAPRGTIPSRAWESALVKYNVVCGDFGGSGAGVVGAGEFFERWRTGDQAADLNGDGRLDTQDLWIVQTRLGHCAMTLHTDRNEGTRA